jgi:hypothetical protein
VKLTENSINTWGHKVIKKTLEYANFEWYATGKNVMHGIDYAGRFVNTPDITWKGEALDCGWWKVNETNVGIPYSWGNASTLEELKMELKKENMLEMFLKIKRDMKVIILLV